MDRVWWNNITKARKFVDDIVTAALEGKSIILSLPEAVPWYDTFVELIQEQLQMENSKNAFETISCPEEEVGLYLLNKYCRKEKRATYRYGQTYAAFLGKSDDIVLNDRYIWVTDIPKSKYDEWIDFIVEYNKNVTTKTPAIFILETHDDSYAYKAKKGIKKLFFDQNIGPYDKFAFCTLAATENNCKEYMRPYLAELAAAVCGDDIELCAACVKEGSRFLENPVEMIRQIVERKYRSNGERYQFLCREDEIQKRIWEAQLKHVFLLIEKYRNYFTARYANAIKKALPIHNSNGEVVENPQDVELGTLFYMAGKSEILIEEKEYIKLEMYRNARNRLAHLGILDLETVEEILGGR